MYRWYKNAAVCYVHLADVSESCPHLSDATSFHPSILRWMTELEDSRWFTRGWTLQELIAPSQLYFFGQSWNYIGSLPDLIQWVSRITNIQTDVLDGSRPLSDLSIARRLSWAAKRKTTRLEDQAYSLFGILDVNMPLLYGEGKKAFLRLQEEIIRQSTDQSVFAWDAPAGFIESRELLLAPSPACFLNGSRIRRRRGTAGESAFRISNKGLEITLPIVEQRLREDPSNPYVTLGILDCKYEGSSNVLALVMKQHPFNIQGATSSVELYVSGYERSLGAGVAQYGRILPINPRDVEDAVSKSLTITRDLQSQTYIQTFNTNKSNWFPIRFVGDAQKYMPRVESIYPEDCWYETSQTMRLRSPQYPYGAVVVRIQESKHDGGLETRPEEPMHILVAFGISSSSQNARPSRKIYAISYIDPNCPIEPHVDWLSRRTQQAGVDAASLRLDERQRLVAQLWNGALTVTIESSGGSKKPQAPSIHSLSPPSSPVVKSRTPSFSSASRRDSLLQDDFSDRSETSQDDTSYAIHRTSQCENCRHVKAKWKADCKREEEERRRKLEEDAAKRRRLETQRRLKKDVRTVATGLSLTGVLAEAAEFVM